MDGTEAIFDCTEKSVASEAITFKGEDSIDQMFQHLRASQHPLLGDMTHQQERCGLTFGEPLQSSRTFTHLTD